MDDGSYKVPPEHIRAVLNYLMKGRFETIPEIAKALGVKEYTVAVSLMELVGKGIVCATPDNPHKFYSIHACLRE